MSYDLAQVLCCPDCRSKLEFGKKPDGALSCSDCNVFYPVIDGIPLLLSRRQRLDLPTTGAVVPDAGTGLEYKDRQMHFYESKYRNADWWFEVERPHNSGKAGKFVTLYPLEKMTRAIPIQELLQGSVVLNVGCGTGLEAEYFSRFNCEIIGLDFSLAQLQGAQERMKRRGFKMALLSGDITAIPMADLSVDFSLAYESLHHLPNPYDGFREMCRVARKGVILFEPRESLVRRVALRLGMATNREVVGNIVMDVSEVELASISTSYGFEPRFVGRYIYKEFFRPPKFYRYFENAVTFWTFRTFFQAVNLLAGRIGNKVTFVGLRP